MNIGAMLDSRCEIIVLIPVCNEERYIARCIEAFACQSLQNGRSLPFASFEIHLLVNNTTDSTVAILSALQLVYAELRLRIEVVDLPPEQANVGTARRRLFEGAAERFALAGRSGILACTDADTVVAETWISSTLAAFQTGVDAVAGFIAIQPDEFRNVSEHVRHIIAADRQYRMLLEVLATSIDVADPEPWPRHYHHTGASLALTSDAYRRCGGMPSVATHEDIALVRALRRIDAKISHRFNVHVGTSPRYQGRARNGMGACLSEWDAIDSGPQGVLVRHPEQDLHRLQARAHLRAAWIRRSEFGLLPDSSEFPNEIIEGLKAGIPFGEIWGFYTIRLRRNMRVDANVVPISWAIGYLSQILLSYRGNHRVGSGLTQIHRQVAI
jgi:GT2 family glycosyltransferase